MKNIIAKLLLPILLLFSISTNSQNTYHSDINKELASKISPDSLIKTIQNQNYKNTVERGLIELKNLCIDDTIREYSVYIPEKYNSNKKIPLFIYLHGGVSTKDLEPDSSWHQYINSLPWMKMAEKENYICLFPKAEYSAMWWDTVGSANILSQIRNLKSIYNIDDNRVYLNGFSDGASASYHMAMSYATDFASFNPYNGYPAVGMFTKATPAYFVNLQNTYFHAINTDLDGLYPDKKIQPMIKLAQSANANILYRVYTGVKHRMTYINKELPKAIKFLEENPRNKFPTKITWQTLKPEQGRFNWLQITKTDTLQKKQDWHINYNMKTVNDRLSFGFMEDREYKEKGIKISRVAGGICKEIELQAGDIFIKIDTFNMQDMRNMVAYKKQASRGDSVRLEILRNNKLLIFNTKFPEPEYFDIFRYNKKTGQIRAEYIANTFYVKTSRIKAFSIYIHPDMVQLDQKVRVIANGKEIFNDFVKPDSNFIINNYIKNVDKELLYINKLDFNL